MSVIQELWTPEILLQRFKGSEFITKSRNLSYAIAGNGIVHLPQAGLSPKVKKNPDGSFQTAKVRKDTDLTFKIEQYYTEPTVITEFQEKQTSPQFRASIIAQHGSVLNQASGNHALYNWAPATLAAANSVEVSGNVGLIHFNKAKSLLDKMLVPNDGRRVAIVPTAFEQELFQLPEYISAFNMGQTILGAGKLINFMGFQMISRATAVSYDSNGAIKAVGEDGEILTPAVGDVEAILCWHEDFVVHAVNNPKVFFTLDSPNYVGSVLNMAYFQGFAKAYTDESGIVTIVKA